MPQTDRQTDGHRCDVKAQSKAVAGSGAAVLHNVWHNMIRVFRSVGRDNVSQRNLFWRKLIDVVYCLFYSSYGTIMLCPYRNNTLVQYSNMVHIQ